MIQAHGPTWIDPTDGLTVTATLRIADHIVAGVTQIDDLAAATGCDSYALHRVLTHLAGKGILEEPAPGRFALNQTSEGLLDGDATRPRP